MARFYSLVLRDSSFSRKIFILRELPYFWFGKKISKLPLFSTLTYSQGYFIIMLLRIDLVFRSFGTSPVKPERKSDPAWHSAAKRSSQA